MGDVRFDRALDRLLAASDLPAAIRDASMDELIMALAATSPDRDALLVNVLATELLNRSRRVGAVAQNIAEGVYIVDPEGIITYVNPSAEHLIGTSAATLVGRRADAIRFRDEKGRIIPWEERPTRRAVMEGRESPPARLSLERADGGLVPVDMMAAPVRADGEIIGAILSFRDTSAERQGFEEVRFHKELLDHVGEAVVATRLDGTIVYWNRSAERLFGWEAAEVIGRPIVDVTPAETTRDQAHAIMEAMQHGQTWAGIFPLRHRSGAVFLGHVTNAPVIGERGEIVAIIGVTRPLESPPMTPATAK